MNAANRSICRPQNRWFWGLFFFPTLFGLWAVELPGMAKADSPPDIPPQLECSAETVEGAKQAHLRIRKNRLEIQVKGGKSSKHKIQRWEVLGKGVEALMHIQLSDGTLQYHDEYGNLSRVKLELNERGEPFQNFSCTLKKP